MQHSIFEIKLQAFDRLEPARCEEYWRRLLEVEARCSSIPLSNISASQSINASDGGVDAFVKADNDSLQGIIKKGKTYYQIKSGTIRLDKSSIKEILFNQSSNKLKPQIKDCFDNNGTFILVCFKEDYQPLNVSQGKEFFTDFLKEVYNNKSDFKIEIWSRNQIKSYFQHYWTLAINCGLIQLPETIVPISIWSNQDDMRVNFHKNNEQNNKIERIKNFLRNKNDKLLRFLGQSGSGKTRTVLEALKEREFYNFVIYFSSFDEFKYTEIKQRILPNEDNDYIIVVIDECDEDGFTFIKKKMNSSKNTYFIAIGNILSRNNSKSVIELGEIDQPTIEEIIKEGNEHPPEIIYNYSACCKGSPRLAHAIQEYLYRNPGKLLNPQNLENVFEKMISGYSNAHNSGREKQKILMRLALFEKFGYSGQYAYEFDYIVEKIIDMPKQNCEAYIHELKNSKILQGKHTLYISPLLMQIWLHEQFWEIHRMNSEELERLLNDMPESLKVNFFKMFQYVGPNNEQLKPHIKEFFSKNGLFKDLNSLFEKSKFFFNLSLCSTEDSLNCLERLFSNKYVSELENFQSGRQDIVFALKQICSKKDFFQRGIKILLKLAESEKLHIYSNDSEGSFVELFNPFSASAALMNERYSILKQIINSPSKKVKLIAVKAINSSLSEEAFVSGTGIHIFNSNTLEKHMPIKTLEELYDWWKKVWALLETSFLDCRDDEQKSKMFEVILEKSNYFIKTELCDFIIESFKKIIKHHDQYRYEILSKLDYLQINKKQSLNNISEDILRKIQDFQSSESSKDYSFQTNRVLKTPILNYSEESRNELKTQIKKIAKESIENSESFTKELPWLMTDKALHGFEFGKTLAAVDVCFNLLSKIFDSFKNSEEKCTLFFGAYLSIVFEKKTTLWQEYMKKIYNDEALRCYFIEILYRSQPSMDDSAASLLIKGFKEGKLKENPYLSLLSLEKLSENKLNELLNYLLSLKKKEIIYSILKSVHKMIPHANEKSNLSKKMLFDLLTNKSFFLEESRVSNSFVLYHWMELGHFFIQNYSDHEIKVRFSKKIINILSKARVSFFHGQKNEIFSVINPVIEECWTEVMKDFFNLLDCDSKPFIKRYSLLFEWLKTDPFCIDGQNYEKIIPFIKEWIEEDRKNRAPLLARFASINFSQNNLFRFLIENYPDEKVFLAFPVTHGIFSFSGSISKGFGEKKNDLERTLESETNINMKEWIQKQLSDIKHRVRYWEEEDERMDF